MPVSHELVEEVTIPSVVHLNGPYWVDLHVGASIRLAKNYVGLSLGAANEVALRYLLKHVDGVVPWLH